MGAELPQPVVTENACSFRSPTKGASGHRTRLLKNIVGLWLVQECRRIWKLAGKTLSWDDLSRLAAGGATIGVAGVS